MSKRPLELVVQHGAWLPDAKRSATTVQWADAREPAPMQIVAPADIHCAVRAHSDTAALPRQPSISPPLHPPLPPTCRVVGDVLDQESWYTERSDDEE